MCARELCVAAGIAPEELGLAPSDADESGTDAAAATPVLCLVLADTDPIRFASQLIRRIIDRWQQMREIADAPDAPPSPPPDMTRGRSARVGSALAEAETAAAGGGGAERRSWADALAVRRRHAGRARLRGERRRRGTAAAPAEAPPSGSSASARGRGARRLAAPFGGRRRRTPRSVGEWMSRERDDLDERQAELAALYANGERGAWARRRARRCRVPRYDAGCARRQRTHGGAAPRKRTSSTRPTRSSPSAAVTRSVSYLERVTRFGERVDDWRAEQRGERPRRPPQRRRLRRLAPPACRPRRPRLRDREDAPATCDAG